MARKNLLDTLLDIGKDVTRKVIQTLEPIFGFEVQVFHPLSSKSKSVYGSDDNKWLYSKDPTETSRFICLNLFDEEFFLGDLTYDPFPTSQAYILTHGQRVIPKNSMVIIYKGENHYKGKISEHKVLNGRNGAIFVKNLISPIA